MDARSQFDAAFSREAGIPPEDRQRIAHLQAVLPGDARTVLDAGSGPGHVARAVAATGRAVSCMDLSPVAVRKVVEGGLPCVEAGIDAIPFPDASFDLVMACEVLEHLPEEAFGAALRELARVARRYVLLTVPNRDHLPTLRQSCPRCGAVAVPWGHVRSFRLPGLPRLLPGFDCVRAEAFGPPVPDGFHPVTRLLRAPRAWPPPLSRGMRCPACGHVEERRAREVVRSLPPHRALLAGLAVASTLLEARVAPTCPRWLLALYRRGGS